MSAINFRSDFPKILNWAYPILSRLLGVDDINKLLAKLGHLKNHNFITEVLRSLDVHAEVSYRNLRSIPSVGAVIFVANHPSGMVEGLLGLSIISRLRPDIKIIGNKVLLKFMNITDLLIPVDRR